MHAAKKGRSTGTPLACPCADTRPQTTTVGPATRAPPGPPGIREGSKREAKMLRRRFTAAMHGRPRKLALIVPLDLGVCLVDHRVEIAAVEQLKAAPDELSRFTVPAFGRTFSRRR